MKNILIIDDDEIVCKLMEKLSQLKDVLVTIARNGEDTKNVLQSGKKFDVIFLDLLLPYISGWDILTIINNDPVTKDIPVIVMTRFSLSEEELKRMHGKVSAIINKKIFNEAEFEEKLKKLL